MHERHQRRNEEGSGKVYEDRVGRYVVDVASKLFCDHRSRRSRRAYQTYHGAFEHYAEAAVRHRHKYQAYGEEETALYQQQP